ncbi:MAG: metallophosphoesterase, partial [Lysobacterales bacterium]
MRLVHLTDLHLSSLEKVHLLTLWGKRWSGYGAWWKNPARKHLQRMLQTMLTAVRAENADQILVTGDLLQIGLKSEMAQAAQWLPLLGSEERVMLIPGNHDIYTRKSAVEIMHAWRDYLFHGAAGEGRADFPVTRELDGVCLIGLNSARPTPVFLANGRLGEGQLSRLEALLRKAAAAQRAVVLLIHHPPLPGMTKWRVALRDAAELQAVLATYPPLLVLHGHMHRNREQRWG